MTDRLADLEARVQRMEDREAIQMLFMRYRECLDEKDFSGYAALFATDGDQRRVPIRISPIRRFERNERIVAAVGGGNDDPIRPEVDAQLHSS